jgi:hypothetical protein
MKRIILILLTITLSCAERELQLPVTTSNDITKILDVSPIYMFYNEETDSVDFNRKNMISTTNWLVNIDKRLTLKQILPHLQYLQEKRHGDGMHKNEKAKNYFTCFNENTKSLSFIEFTDVKFKVDTLFYFKTPKALIHLENPEKKKLTTRIISFRGNNSFYLDKKEYSNDSLKEIIKDLSKTHPHFKNIIIGFKESLSFQEYISLKTKLLDLNLDSKFISDEEIIYY